MEREGIIILAARAAKRAATLLTGSHIYYEDMRQAAASAILDTYQSGQNDAGYLWRVGYLSALQEFFFMKMEKKTHDTHEPGIKIVSLPEYFATKPADGVPTFVEENFDKVVDLFLDARKKKGQRGERAALRDATICLLVERGSTNREIGEILGIPAEHVKVYRQKIRNVLASNVMPEGESQK